MMITALELQAFIETRNRFADDKLQLRTFDGIQFAEGVDQSGNPVRIQVEQFRYHRSLYEDNPRIDALFPPEALIQLRSDMFPLAAILSERALTLSSVFKPSIPTILLFRVPDRPYRGMFTPRRNQVSLLGRASYSEVWSWTAEKEEFTIKHLRLMCLHPYRPIPLEF